MELNNKQYIIYYKHLFLLSNLKLYIYIYIMTALGVVYDGNKYDVFDCIWSWQNITAASE